MDAEQFLARVVAPGNYTAINWKDPARDGMATRLFPRDRLGETAGFLRWISSKGSDAYFGVASYAEAEANGTDPRGNLKFKGTRRRENAQNMRAFWVDIDVKREGDKKDGANVYADRREAVAWLLTFLAATKLPRPNLWVNSGYGYHWYWVLEDPMTIAEWQPYADAFAHALRTNGFKSEAGLTSDAARILRPPDTMNQKGGAKAAVSVISKHSLGDYPNAIMLQALQPFVGQGPASTTVVSANTASALAGGAPSAVLAGHGNLSAAAQANLPTKRHHSFATIASKCAQIGRSLLTGGNGDPYQLWYLGFLSLAHYCVDGSSFVHEISKGDPRYTQQAVDDAVKRIDGEQATKDRGPPRCSSFDNWRTGICSGCPHFGKVLGPWNLGADENPTTTVVETKTGGSAAGPISGIPKEMTLEQALSLMNQTFFFTHDWGGEPVIVHVSPNGVRALSEQQFRAMLANRYVKIPVNDGTDKPTRVERIPLGRLWLTHPQRREVDRVIYDPENTRAPPNEAVFNLWTGLAKTPERGNWSKLARHIHGVVCKRDRRAWRYFVRWLAHAVQHPGTAPGTVPVLKSDAEGTGKSTVLEWMARIFGEHALMLSTPEDLVGQFNSHLERMSLIGLNEPAFPGDHRAAGKLKSMITEPTWLINEKFRAARRVPNIAHIMLTTNASWAVPAGNQARRFFVLEVDEQRAGDHAYFGALWAEANGGGIEAMLYALLRINLSSFDPADVPKTQALRQQQVRSAPTTTQWAVDAATAGELILPPIGLGSMPGSGGGFGAKHPSAVLYAAYKSWASAMHQRPAAHVEFGRWLGRCGFARTVVRGISTYDIPDATTFGNLVLRQAGIR